MLQIPESLGISPALGGFFRLGEKGATPPVTAEIRRNPEKRCIFGNWPGNYLVHLK